MSRMWSHVLGLSHLFMTVCLTSFAITVVAPAIIDVAMAAVCPGKDECSLAIYLTGVQQAIVGLGSVVVLPMIGKLSDTYGRKAMLNIPIILSIFPVAILSYSTEKYYFYAYYVLTTLTVTIEGSVQFLALAYLADNVEERKRGSVFGIMCGLSASSYLLGSISSRFLSTSAAFKVGAVVWIIAFLYMNVFLRESISKNNVPTNSTEADCLLDKVPPTKWKLLQNDTICMMRNSPAFSKAAIVALLSTVAEVGYSASVMYYLKAQFQFNKDNFADLMIIIGISASVSQLVLMPILTPLLGEKNMLSIGLFSSIAQGTLVSFAWSSWVPYGASMTCVVSSFTQPCLRIIASKQTRPTEQGKALGCISGVCSFAGIVSPLGFTPLTALFLSENAPFHFPGFSILCTSFVGMIALSQSIALRQLPPPPVEEDCTIISNSTHVQTLT